MNDFEHGVLENLHRIGMQLKIANKLKYGHWLLSPKERASLGVNADGSKQE